MLQIVEIAPRIRLILSLRLGVLLAIYRGCSGKLFEQSLLRNRLRLWLD